jgi:acetyl esterase/lipase
VKTLTRLTAMLLTCAAPAFAADKDLLNGAELLDSIWYLRRTLNTSSQTVMVVRADKTDMAASAKRSRKLTLKPVLDLRTGKPPEAKSISARVYIKESSNRLLADRMNADCYLALVRRYNVGRNKNKQTRWNLTYFRKRDGLGNTNFRYIYLLALRDKDEPVLDALADLMLGPSGQSAREFEKMLEYVTGEDARARQFAAAFAGNNGWGFGDADIPNERDRFTEALLTLEDPIARERMASAYSQIGKDMLPRSKKLFDRLLASKRERVLSAAFGENLRHATDRAKQLIPWLRPALGEPGEGHEQLRLYVLRGLVGWGEQARPLAGEMEKIVLARTKGEVTEAERRAAIAALDSAKGAAATELLRETLDEVPSAVALNHAVEHRDYAAVPVLIKAARLKKIDPGPLHLAALSLLTRRFPDGDFEEFDRWWARIEKDGRAEEAVETGFADPKQAEQARKLIEQLGSVVYRRRVAARKKLARMGLAIEPILMDAVNHRDAEIAVAAGNLIAEGEQAFATPREELRKAADRERAGGGASSTDSSGQGLPAPPEAGMAPQDQLPHWSPNQYRPHAEYTYKFTANGQLRMYLSYPFDWRPSDRRPAILFFHGGGWNSGTVAQFFRHVAYLASRGMVAGSVQYRLKSTHEARVADCVRDARSAIRYLRARAGGLGIDPDRILAGGGSAGGHLAFACAMFDGPEEPGEDTAIPCDVAALVQFNPVLAFRQAARDRFGLTEDEGRRLSPMEHLSPALPPTILFFGAEDTTCPQFREFAEKARSLGCRADLHVYEGEGHGFYNREPYFKRTLHEADRFLAELGYLSGPPTVEAG